jgi:Predicted nucleic-acid-binding protein, contains PIN domain
MVQGCVTSHSLTDIFYILRKDFSVEKRKQLIQLLCEEMNVIPETRQSIVQALSRREWQDIEDALQMQCAKEAGAEYIVTQNLKDFQSSEVKAIDEKEFCAMLSSGF